MKFDKHLSVYEGSLSEHLFSSTWSVRIALEIKIRVNKAQSFSAKYSKNSFSAGYSQGSKRIQVQWA